GFEASLRGARVRALAARVREALAGASDEATLTDPARQERFRAVVDPLDLPGLKEVAAELGAGKPSARARDAVVAAIVEKVTGVRPAAPKKGKAAAGAAPLDQAAVQQQAVRLKELLEKSVDPDGLSEAEVDAALVELDRLKVAQVRAVAQEAGLENVGRSKA